MLRNLTFQAKRENLPQMLTQITAEISKYVTDEIWLNRLKLCAEEILVNIIDYSGSEKLYISCEYVESEKALKFEFADDGTPYNPLANDTGVDVDAEMEDRTIGGLGIFLYTTIMDKMAYKYENGKNYLMATKNLDAGEVN